MNIENKKQFATLILAVGLGLVAAFGVAYYVQDSVNQQTARLSKDYEKKGQVLVDKINSLDSRVQQAGAQNAQLEQRIGQLQQMIAQQPQGGGEGATAKPTMVGALSVRTPPGKRAVTIMIDALSAVGGLINPGEYVDVIAQLDVKETEDNGGAQKVTTILFQNLQILAVGTNFTSVGEVTRYEAQQNARSLNVTLAVDPEEAGLLTFVQSNGKLQLSLRPLQEQEIKSMQVASWDALSEYIMQKQGTDLLVPKKKAKVEAIDSTSGSNDDSEPLIQIFRAGREL